MANILDYLDWFGNISFEQVSFNEVDALVFAQMSYLDLKDIVPPLKSSNSLTVEQTAEAFFAHNNKESLYTQNGIINPLTPLVLQKMSVGKRYKDARLFGLQNTLDTNANEQFFALACTISTQETILCVRGTDETIAGWHEDCMMCFDEVPAQHDALTYLEQIAQDTTGILMLTGHSKGGNLALYAAGHAHPKTQERIHTVWNMDGPGFSPELESFAKIQPVAHKVKTFVPEFAFVSGIMKQVSEVQIIKSSATGLFCHDALSWEVLGTSFVKAQEIDSNALALTNKLNALISKRTLAERKNSITSLFQIFNELGITTLEDLKNPKTLDPRKIPTVLKTLNQGDRQDLVNFALLLAQSSLAHALTPLNETVSSMLHAHKDLESAEISVEDYKRWKRMRPLTKIKKSIDKFGHTEEETSEKE